jgi:TldD protein
MNEFKNVMEYVKTLGVDYADMRFKDISIENIRIENGKVVTASTERSKGYGIRVYVDGAMGFVASHDIEMDKMEAAVKQAYEIARASLIVQAEKVQLDNKTVANETYSTPMETDPVTVPLSDKLALMMECDSNMKKSEGVSRTYVNLAFRKDNVIFVDTDGSFVEQDFCQCTASLGAIALSKEDMQKRSYINVIRAGYESILDWKLPQRALTIGKEAVELLIAPECPSGEFDIILTPRQMFLQIHESVGHPTELDRVLGSEAAFAGASFFIA